MKMILMKEKKRWVIGVGIVLLILCLLIISYLISDSRRSISTVIVQTEHYTGQGIVYECKDNEVHIATAAHVLEGLQENDSCSVLLKQDLQVDGRVEYISETADVAFIMINLLQNGKASTDIMHLKAVKKDRERFDRLQEGSIVFAYDHDNIKTTGNLISPWIYLEDFQLNMMIAKLPCKPGMSGCGVYDEKGYLTGIICGMNEEETAILPFSVLESEWMMVNH